MSWKEEDYLALRKKLQEELDALDLTWETFQKYIHDKPGERKA